MPLEEAARRFLAGRLTTRSDAPRRACAVMDVYAVGESGTNAGEWLDCIGEVRAGRLPEQALEPGQAVRNLTGAFLPQGADCVIMQEYAERDGDRVRFREGFGPARHVCETGSDFRSGDVLVPEGSLLTPQAIVAAAATDWAEVEVRLRPRVAIIATGGELVAPGKAHADEATLANSASYGVAAMAEAGVGRPVWFGMAQGKPVPGLPGQSDVGHGHGALVPPAPAGRPFGSSAAFLAPVPSKPARSSRRSLSDRADGFND